MEDPDNIRLVGKAEYKGKTYYVLAITNDRTRCRLVTLDQKLDFWVQLVSTPEKPDVAKIIKTYEPREERGNYGRPTGRMVYTTLGSIKKFIERQREGERTGNICADCGKAAHLILDHEDGQMKCRACCDIPSE